MIAIFLDGVVQESVFCKASTHKRLQWCSVEAGVAVSSTGCGEKYQKCIIVTDKKPKKMARVTNITCSDSNRIDPKG